MYRIALLLITTALLLSSAVAIADETRPNIVIILVDDMGYGDPGCFNPESKISTPNIDRLAAEGMRFIDAHAPGALCHVSRYGLMTGRYPFRTNVGVWSRQAVIEADRPTIASLARAAGYRTTMVGKWHLGFDENGYDKPLPGGPVDRGFDYYFGIRASTDIPPYFFIRDDRAVQPPTETIGANSSKGWSPIQGAFWRKGGIAPDLKLEEVLPRFTNEAIEVIEGHQLKYHDKPLLLHLAYPAPHTPWLPSEEFVGKSQVGMYGDFTMMVDHEIGRVLKAVERLGDNTLVIFTSDNGPVWYDADVKRFDHDSAGGLRGMKADAWEAGHRMPFIARWPAKVKAGATSEQLICFTDLMATFSAIWQRDMPEGAGPDSFDFSSVLFDAPAAEGTLRKSLASQHGRGMMVIRHGPWKMITGLGSGGFSKPSRVDPDPGGPAGQLYHLGEDLAEANNLYQDKPEIVKRLRAELERIR